MKRKTKNTVLAGFSVAPFGVGEHLSRHVAEALKIVIKSGLDYRLTPMQTCVEGDFDRVMKVIAACHKHMIKKAPRVLTTITIDDRRGMTGRMTGKIRSVEKAMGKNIKH